MSLQTRVLNFALITKLPHQHLPSLFHVHGVAVSPPARPRAASSPLSPSLVLPKPPGLSTRRHLPARTPRTAVDAPRRRKRRAVPCAASQLAVKPLPCPSSATTHRPNSISLVPCISQACPLPLPVRAEAPPHHGRRLHLGRRRASSCAPPLPKPTL